MDHIELTARLWSAYAGEEYKAEEVSDMLALERLAAGKTGRDERKPEDIAEHTDSEDKTPEETKASENTVKNAPKRKSRPRRELDDGKIQALRNAGWSLAKIADEMHSTPQTILYHINKARACNTQTEE